MGYINIKITDIQIPNDFLVYYKQDDGSGKPYPINGSSWTDYGALVSVSAPIFTGGTSTIMLSGSTISNPDLPDFQYGTTYWIKLVEYDYPDRYVIKNIRIFDSVAFGEVAPVASPTASPLPTRSLTPSITRTLTPTISISLTPTMTQTQQPTPTPTPSISVSSSTGASPSRTPSTTPSITPSITPTAAISEVYFASLDGETGLMGVNNPGGKVFTLGFTYELMADSDNIWSNGQEPCQATTYLFYSTNNGGSWNEVDSITASVPGGTYPVAGHGYETSAGAFTITGITDVSQVRIRGEYDCVWTLDGKDGTVYVVLTGVTVNVGEAAIVCDDTYYIGCLLEPTLSCQGVPVTPSITPTMTPSRTMTPSPSPEVINVSIRNETAYGIIPYIITNVEVGPDGDIYDVTLDFPLYPGDVSSGRSPQGTGISSVIVSLTEFETVYSNTHIILTDSDSTVQCKEVTPGTTAVHFFNVSLSSTGISIVLHESGDCPPPPSPSTSRTPSISISSSPSPTPNLTPTRTPTASPTTFGYYVDIYACNGSICGNYVSNAWIQNEYYMAPGQWYKYDNDYVYYVNSVAPLGGNATSVVGPGQSSCNDACAAPLPM